MYLYVYFYVLLLLLYFYTKEQHTNMSVNQNTRQSVGLNLLMKGHSFSPFLQSRFSLIFFCYLTLLKVLALPLVDTCQLFWKCASLLSSYFKREKSNCPKYKRKNELPHSPYFSHFFLIFFFSEPKSQKYSQARKPWMWNVAWDLVTFNP